MDSPKSKRKKAEVNKLLKALIEAEDEATKNYTDLTVFCVDCRRTLTKDEWLGRGVGREHRKHLLLYADIDFDEIDAWITCLNWLKKKKLLKA